MYFARLRPMLRSLILGWLIICIFGYGSVWAFDSHAGTPEQHESHVSTQYNLADGDDHSSCDHCCHAASHMTGLWSGQAMAYVQAANKVVPFNHPSYHFLPTDPPDHPPRS